MKTLECYLLDAEHRGVTLHTLTVSRGRHGEVMIGLSPQSLVGDDRVFEVRGDVVTAPLPVVEFGHVGELVEGPALATREDMRKMMDRMAEVRDSIQRGARRTGPRFKL